MPLAETRPSGRSSKIGAAIMKRLRMIKAKITAFFDAFWMLLNVDHEFEE